ncbi:NAD synthetase (EC 6.3.1.5) / Glutamine amidotransferase chain of NAD synthetase [uncultured Gammaproteobacteria bacterium]|uniref:NAD+ synthase n=1 Tax=Bathymodiolus heckerae thiotrophic gill symbiont TaxID=1052212 RepID=UPI0010B7AE5A|nr:NAD+ synthase [Bathymodiolus heckerae thiotrophic gill symbiont]CAC9546322.1 NAD synthetase (EC 6.3.1.5) / Glutamine amidotransferase chain of NAD synthetase [uncultured Gammaproteobacteria bacterium]CAC9581378.1 NAD synthetase (EC 6.3.1.5) / Glutamine amidotransferase chain of NAD synthetase [uncultured Gammaproteobacteria bacterium]CAC9586921.1 NAD synthetase (EC 6.3.1.5) / Glutamine amidotransferase chain of NAD synthetase [uncultured Gammaproteobacteria bacterium]CAC9951547.1 NAD synthet
MANKTKDYLAKVRKKTGFSDYKISQEYGINQSNLSKYKSGKSSLSETHAWLFADILKLNPAEVVAYTKLESAKIKGDKSKAIFWQEQLDNLSTTTESIKIDIAQINPTVGDLDNNTQKIIDLSIEAAKQESDLLVFPELALVGYLPEDLLLRHGFMQQVERKINLIKNSIPDGITIIFGAPCKRGKILYNSAYLIQDNEIHTYHKQQLPNYSVFDEKRYFTAGNKPFIFTIKGQRLGLLVCADIWNADTVSETVKYGVQTIVSINASPFHTGKHQQRLDEVTKRILENRVGFVYANLVGGQDEIVFDGGSFIMDAKAKITHQLPFFEVASTSSATLDTTDNNSIEKTIYDALVLATKDYINKNGVFNGVVIGLSGGIDSALTLAIAADAIGSEHIKAIMMPYTYTSNISLEDAKAQASTMNIDYHEIAIHSMIENFNTQLSGLFSGMKADTTEENLQARVRGTLLMAISNKLGKIVLTTGNKSEMAVGYATLYGDMSGGFAPLKDVSKTMVYLLAKYRNTLSYIIPGRVIDREPSAELAPDQVDQDSLPPYDELDGILELFVEQRRSIDYIVKMGFDKQTVTRISRLVLNNEYKRRQSAPGPKISKNAFGKERRYPMTSKFQP